MHRMTWTTTFAVGLGLAFGFAATAPADAQSVEQFYKGKQVKMLIGGGPGGTYDT